jgi:hypothetical protein
MARSIQISDAELVDLQKFYSLQLEQAEQRVQDLRNTLSKLGVSMGETTGKQATAAPVAKEAAPQAEDASTSNKPGRKKKSKKLLKKPKWGEFILEFLNSQARLVRVGSIIDEALAQYDIPEEEHKGTEQAIYNGLNRLQKVNLQVNGYQIPGKKGRYYGLREWFNEDGTPKDEFLEKVDAEANA